MLKLGGGAGRMLERPAVTKISKIACCHYLPRNAAGRDLVVGDLHGHRSLLERELEGIGFDPTCDRVFSVGDLIDRGPDSLETLSLIEEPWFHAVIGNHELMLLNFLHAYESRLHSRKAYSSGGGEWIGDAISRDRKAVSRLAERIALLPLAIHVEDAIPFYVAHADLPRTVRRMVSVHEADAVTSSRTNINAALKTELTQLTFGTHVVQISPTPLAGMPVTYAGHSRVRDVTVHNSYVYIDQGVCLQTSKRPSATPPTLLDHGKFANWLAGVTAARTGASAETLRELQGSPVSSLAW